VKNRDLATFLVAAPDQPGLVARLAGFFADRGANIVDAQNHSEPHAEEGHPRFYMRLVVELDQRTSPSRPELEAAFAGLAGALDAAWSVGYADVVQKVAVLVTKESACLYDLILRQRSGELACEISLVVSNHAHLEPVARGFGIPFVALPVTPETRREQERLILDELGRHQVAVVVLARYMQVLSADFLAAAPPVINIHHGFLPAFQGGRPYHQAYARGVKMIGATAHYATSDLDQGPIIEQDVVRVSHRDDVPELVRKGRDLEMIVLAKAVWYHLNHRLLVYGDTTVVFS
jgi:formyltetrahydrofolate deformylase